MRAITNEVNENYPDTDGRKGEESCGTRWVDR